MWFATTPDKGLLPCTDSSPLSGLRLSVFEPATSVRKKSRVRFSRLDRLRNFDSRGVYRTCLDFQLIVADGESKSSTTVNPTSNRSQEPMASPVLSKTDSRKNLDDPRWHLVQRIVVSRSMGRSPLLSEFLLYICERHLRNQSAELTEQRIGVHVFGRSEGYNSNDDNIVRNYARTLRKRVEDYFATEGKHEDLRLEIPRGAYVPVFYSRSPEDSPQREEPHREVSMPGLSLIEETPREQPLPSPKELLPTRFVRSVAYLVGALLHPDRSCYRLLFRSLAPPQRLAHSRSRPVMSCGASCFRRNGIRSSSLRTAVWSSCRGSLAARFARRLCQWELPG